MDFSTKKTKLPNGRTVFDMRIHPNGKTTFGADIAIFTCTTERNMLSFINELSKIMGRYTIEELDEIFG